MENQPDLQSAERKVLRTAFTDGLWDILIGCILLMFAIAPLLNKTLGDFWGSVIFLPFWGLVYLAIRAIRKNWIEPRVGIVRLSRRHKRRMRMFSMVAAVFNALVLMLGIIVLLVYDDRLPGGIWAWLMGLFALCSFSLAAYFLDCPRFYVYGLLLAAAPQIGEWLYTHHGASHHGYPLVFGISAGVIILIGLGMLIHLLITHPKVAIPEES